MTLLEALVALVILGLAAVGFMGLFQTTSRSTREAEAWIQAVGYAEATMEQTKIGNGTGSAALPADLPPGFAADVEVRPWLAGEGLAQVTVTVSLPDGGAFVLNRLVRAP